jgi:oligopeptide transport system substrate-binding protein
MVADYEDYLEGVEGAELGVSAPDDKTFVVTLAYPCPYFTEICAFSATAPVRQDIIEANGESGWYMNPETYVTNGPYTMESWTNQDSIVMVKSDTYYNKSAVGPDKITWLLMDDDNTILASYEAGDVIFAGSFPTAEAARLRGMGILNSVSIAGTYYLEIEQEKGLDALKNPDVIRALSLVIDRNYITSTITGMGEVPANSWLPYGFLDNGQRLPRQDRGLVEHRRRRLRGQYRRGEGADGESRLSQRRRLPRHHLFAQHLYHASGDRRVHPERMERVPGRERDAELRGVRRAAGRPQRR